MVFGKVTIDEAVWNIDTSDYFFNKEGFWTNTLGAKVLVTFTSDSADEITIEARVRTGSASYPTSFVSHYKFSVDGVSVPMALDTSRTNEKRTEFGGSHIGYIIGKFKVAKGQHALVLETTKLYCAFDWLNIVDGLTQDNVNNQLSKLAIQYETKINELNTLVGQLYSKAQLDAAVALASQDKFTLEQLNTAVAKGIANYQLASQTKITALKTAVNSIIDSYSTL